MHKSSNILWFALLILNLLSAPAQAQWEVRPEIKWKVIRTAHFEVIYNAEQQDLGLLYAEKLEKAYYQLRSYFSEAPERIPVVINDKTDLTNGYATRIPYPYIMTYPVLPGPEDSLADTGDWAFELLAHEYTHILNFEPAGGVMKPLRYIFGNVLAPNLLLPNWYKEGLAVNAETRLGHHGRLRSTYQDAAIRAMVDEKNFFTFDLAEINEMIPTWPEGMRPYLFGSLMWNQMIADQGEKVIDDLNQRHGRRVPYFVEGPAKDTFGHTYSTEYGTALSQVSELAYVQLKTLREVTPTPIAIAKNSYQYITAPAISPNGKHLAVIAEDDSNNRSVKLLSREDLQQSFLDSKSADTIEKFDQNFAPPLSNDEPMSGSIQRVSWFPDSKKLVYDKINLVNRVESFSDLHVYDLETKVTKNLGKGLRGREPAVSPDGFNVAFVKLEGGKTHLAILKLDKPEMTYEVLFSAPMQERVSYPTYVNDREIVFSWRDNKGNEYLHKYSFDTKKVEKILPDFPNARYARMTSEGLLFASNKNGANNLYLADSRLGSARPVSHTLTGLFMADIDPSRKDIFATVMTAQGYKVGSILKADWQQTPSELPKIEALLKDRLPSEVAHDEEANVAAKESVSKATIDDYSPYGYLWPQYWIPFVLTSSSETGLVLQAMTTGYDPLKKHSYSLLGSWDTRINKGSISGSYLNQTTSLPFVLAAYRRSSYLGDVNNEIDDTSYTGALLPDVFFFSRYTSLQIGYEYFSRSSETSPTTKRMGPFTMLSYTNYTKSGAQIAPESGGGAYLGVYDYLAVEGYLQHWQYLIGGEKYFSNFLPKHNSIMVRAKGVYTPERIPSLYGVSTDSLVFVPDNPLPEYILRGYQRGQIYGRNMVNVNLEYRFPVVDIYNGSGTDPIFLRRISGALVSDGAATDGIFVNTDTGRAEQVNMKRWFWSAGIEARGEATIGYLLPVTLVVGVYNAFNAPSGNEVVLGSALQVSGF
ncbi:hypothetical protein [Bdellovibrio sp. NC01]|uniref:hypothetical protein n=1 Tax=Bdellovibrio sp. NC01 TaxID=2220073 RepID=UPI00115AA766|nr:hypothetical protein [Bdellovibrio sp. NC01]QDK36665.1 hypothetical protein DOE51_03140 [Bdellovibrio sp. NC01]